MWMPYIKNAILVDTLSFLVKSFFFGGWVQMPLKKSLVSPLLHDGQLLSQSLGSKWLGDAWRMIAVSKYLVIPIYKP